MRGLINLSFHWNHQINFSEVCIILQVILGESPKTYLFKAWKCILSTIKFTIIIIAIIIIIIIIITIIIIIIIIINIVYPDTSNVL